MKKIMDFIKGKLSNPIIRKILMVLGIFIFIVLFIIIIASCSKNSAYSYENIEKKMVSSAKSKYPLGSNELPKNDNTFIEVSLDKLISNVNNLNFDKVSCEGYVKIINNYNNYLYVPYLKCEDKYETQTLYNTLTSNVVSTGDGLYNNGNEYIFRGENVNNYLSLNGITYRIISIKDDKSIRVLDMTRNNSYVWDDRYNIEKDNYYGINNYLNNGINSRIKEAIENIYNDDTIYNDDMRSYFVAKPICTGKRSYNDNIFDTSIECSEYIDSYPFTLLNPSEFFQITLDDNCQSIDSPSCLNYNYLTGISTWTITADRDSSYKAFKITSEGVDLIRTSNTGNIYIVTHINPELVVSQGNGSVKNPYVINTYKNK